MADTPAAVGDLNRLTAMDIDLLQLSTLHVPPARNQPGQLAGP